MVSIVLVEGEEIVRGGIKALLKSDPILQVVGEAENGIDAVELAHKLKPNILIADIKVPRLSGLEVLRQVQAGGLPTKVVIFSAHSEETYVLDALKNGAKAYVLKNGKSADLLKAIHEAIAGRHFLSTPLAERAISVYFQQKSDKSDPLETLSNRERLVLQLAAEGNSSSIIARHLGISQRTVETHRSNLMHKLGLHSQTDLVRFAIRRGLVTAD